MSFSTKGIRFYPGYMFHASVTENTDVLADPEAEGYYKVILMKSGTCHFILNQREFVLTGAYAVCLHDKDRIEFVGTQGSDFNVLLFLPSVINGKLSPEVINNPGTSLTGTEFQDLYYLEQFKYSAGVNLKILPLRTIDSEVLGQKMNILRELLNQQDNENWPCRSRSYLFEILFCLVRQEERDEPVRSIQFYQGHSRLAVDIIYYLQSCYNRKITVERLAEEFHTNRTTLLNDFKKHTGMSVSRYLVELRLNMASTMLRDTELSVDEICERTGFSDISYFSKVFKKERSITPSEYRRMNNKMIG